MALIAYDSTGTPRQPRGVFHGQQAAQDQIADLRQQLEQSSDCLQVAILSSGQWQQRAELAERERATAMYARHGDGQLVQTQPASVLVGGS